MKYIDPKWLVCWATLIFSCYALESLAITSHEKTLTTSSTRLDTTITDVNITLSYMGCADNATVTATASVEGSAPPFQFAWSNGDSTTTTGNLAIGSYTVTVTDSLAAIFIDSFMVEELPPIRVEKNVVNAACQGSANGSLSVTISGGTPDYSLSWSTGADSSNLSFLNPGLYFLTVTDANGCSIVDTTRIGQTNELSVQITEQLPATDEGIANGAATAQATGGIPPYNYLWDNNVEGPNLSLIHI